MLLKDLHGRFDRCRSKIVRVGRRGSLSRQVNQDVVVLLRIKQGGELRKNLSLPVQNGLIEVVVEWVLLSFVPPGRGAAGGRASSPTPSSPPVPGAGADSPWTSDVACATGGGLTASSVFPPTPSCPPAAGASAVSKSSAAAVRGPTGAAGSSRCPSPPPAPDASPESAPFSGVASIPSAGADSTRSSGSPPPTGAGADSAASSNVGCGSSSSDSGSWLRDSNPSVLCCVGSLFERRLPPRGGPCHFPSASNWRCRSVFFGAPLVFLGDPQDVVRGGGAGSGGGDGSLFFRPLPVPPILAR
ncbi:hypothetical protein DFJ74DRAFT_401160 [Hyaloraphidium curvatum]|nr:hypothetical protein DFJ74DRAFT_401160 [Hyaloraphidium curvatum]